MRCERCGVMLPRDAVRCPSCGEPRGSEKMARVGGRATGIPTRSFRQSGYGPPIAADTETPNSVVMERLTGPHRAVGYRPIVPPPPPTPTGSCLRPVAILLLTIVALAVIVLLLTQHGVFGL